MSTLWQAAIRDLDVPQIRLHDARHICATLMQGVPTALVAAWLGRADVSFTMRTYIHAQPEALALAALSVAPPVAGSATEKFAHTCGDAFRCLCARTAVRARILPRAGHLPLGAHTPQDAPDRLGRALRRSEEPPRPRSGEQSEETADLGEFLEPVGRLAMVCHANTLPFAALGMDGTCTTGTRSRARDDHPGRRNVRDDARDPRRFLAIVREHGVLAAVYPIRPDDGAEVHDGQRRPGHYPGLRDRPQHNRSEGPRPPSGLPRRSSPSISARP